MAEPIVSLDAIQRRAQRAVESGQPIHQFQAWPVGTAVGQFFQRQVQRLLAVRDAHQQQEISHVQV